jgi:hypothetical protein
MNSSSSDINTHKVIPDDERTDSPVIKFLIYYDIKPGTYSISIKTLYKLFRLWNKDHKIEEAEFVRKLHGQFPYGDNRFIKINKSLASILIHIEDKPKRTINTTKGQNQLRYMEEFLSVHNLKPGKIFIECDILYYLFDYYNHKKKRKPINFIAFASMCRLYFKTKQLGYGSLWFGVNEAIKDMITPEWIKVWRQGRVKYGYISKKMSKKKKDQIYTTPWYDEEAQKKAILYPESLPEKKSQK